LANIASAKKRAKQSEKRRLQNASYRSMLRTHIKKVELAIEGGNKEEATSVFNAVVPMIDRITNKGLIHKNKAARHKHRLHAQIRALS
jgi:small subunit ribosomal protein S20